MAVGSFAVKNGVDLMLLCVIYTEIPVFNCLAVFLEHFYSQFYATTECK